jgi:hypothetical protein
MAPHTLHPTRAPKPLAAAALRGALAGATRAALDWPVDY